MEDKQPFGWQAETKETQPKLQTKNKQLEPKYKPNLPKPKTNTETRVGQVRWGGASGQATSHDRTPAKIKTP